MLPFKHSLEMVMWVYRFAMDLSLKFLLVCYCMVLRV